MNTFKIYTPTEARTDSSAAVLWDKVTVGEGNAEYRVYVNGELRETTVHTDATITGLEPSQVCTVFVEAVDSCGNVTAESNPLTVEAKPCSKVISITDFGAVGDGVRKNTREIQQAIDACEEDGTVLVPKGVFVTGALFLKSHMTLKIEAGGVLFGSPDIEDYPVFHYHFEGRQQDCYASLINTPGNEKLEHVTICGGGLINANGKILYRKELDENRGARGRAVCLRYIDHLYLYDISIRQSPAWCLHLVCCDHVSMNQIRIYNKFDENGVRYGTHNGDGIDPESCNGMNIFNSMIESQDDNIAIKSGRDEEGRRFGVPCRNIRITNCRFSHGFGVAVGSEMSGGVFDVLVQDCVFTDSFSVGSVKNRRGRGNEVARVLYEDIEMVNHNPEYGDCKWFRGAINIDQFYGVEPFDPTAAEEVTEATPIIRDIIFRDVKLETSAGTAVYICGLPEMHLQNITLERVTAKGIEGMKVCNVDGLKIVDCSVVSC